MDWYEDILADIRKSKDGILVNTHKFFEMTPQE
jgi:hypothetical protein